MEHPDFLLNMDWSLLKTQKKRLIELNDFNVF